MFVDIKYYGIYRDYGFMIFDGIKKKKDIDIWLNMFKWRVDSMAESDCLQFTMEVWGNDYDLTIINDKLTYVEEKYFPYLDMKMYWNGSNKLKFQFHLKKNQNSIISIVTAPTSHQYSGLFQVEF